MKPLNHWRISTKKKTIASLRRTAPWALAVAPLIATALTIVKDLPADTAAQPAAQPAAGGAPRVTVIAYNIHWGEGMDGKIDLERQAKVLAKYNPDIVLLQEVEVGIERSGKVDQGAEIARHLGLKHHVFGAAETKAEGELGNSILSRTPLTNVENLELPGFWRPNQLRDVIYPRAAVMARTRPHPNMPEIVVASTHLSYETPESQIAQLQTVSKVLLAEGSPPAILGGDLNFSQTRSTTTPNRVNYQTLIGLGWVDNFAKLGTIDYVLHRKSDPWKLVEAIRDPDKMASDHSAMVAILEWHGGNTAR